MKYYNTPFLLLLCTLAFSLSGCEDMIYEKVMFENMELKTRTPLIPGGYKPNCKVELDMDYASVPHKTASIINRAIVEKAFGYENLDLRAAMDSFANTYSRAYREDLTELYKTEYKQGNINRDWYDYDLNITGEEKRSPKGFVSYEIDVEREEGGAQSEHAVYMMTFNSTTGQQLSLKDVFKPGFEVELHKYLITALLEEMECNTLEELQAMGVLLLGDIEPTENFRLDEEEIEFVYNPYEIAPYDMGDIKLKIPYRLLRNILKKQ